MYLPSCQGFNLYTWQSDTKNYKLKPLSEVNLVPRGHNTFREHKNHDLRGKSEGEPALILSQWLPSLCTFRNQIELRCKCPVFDLDWYVFGVKCTNHSANMLQMLPNFLTMQTAVNLILISSKPWKLATNLSIQWKNSKHQMPQSKPHADAPSIVKFGKAWRYLH